VKGTWATRERPEFVMPFELVKPYATKIAALFKDFDPVYIVACDTDFSNPDISECFMEALEGVKNADPDGLCSFHLTPDTKLPDAFMNSDLFDFYCLQPGHNINEMKNVYKLIGEYYDARVTRPVVNDEFAYEGHSHTGDSYGRYDAASQRKYIWQSVLAGSTAGVAYGAHGLWGWNKAGKPFANSAYGGDAFTWQTALRFKGAWEGPFAKFIIERFNLFDIEPSDELVSGNVNMRNEIRVAKKRGGEAVVVYIPYSASVTLANDYGKYIFTLIDLENKNFCVPEVSVSKNQTRIEMYDFNGDALLIGEIM